MVNTTKNFQTISVQFSVDCKTKFGETVFICGGCQQLGYWTPQNGIKLQTDRRNYPEWSTTRPFMMRPNQMIEFKVCIIRENIVVWETLNQNRVFFVGSKSLQIYINFNSPFMQINEKKVIQMEYRNGTERVMDDMESQWGSSIGYPSNYPLERFHMLQKGHNLGNRSQISSNLMSACDSEDIELQLRIMNLYHPGGLNKTMSRPCEVSPNPHTRKDERISHTNKIISLHSEKDNSSSRKRIYGSLPKKSIHNKQNAIFQQKVSQKYSQFANQQKCSDKKTDKTKTANTQNLFSQWKFMSEKGTFKESPTSKRSLSQEGEDFENDSVEDLFGLEIF